MYNDQNMNNNMNMNNNQGMNMNTNYNGQQYNNTPQNNNNNNKSGSKTIFIIIAVVVALVVFGTFALNKKDSSLDGNQNGTNNNGSSSIDNNNNNQGNNSSSDNNENNSGTNNNTNNNASSDAFDYGTSGKVDSIGLELKMLDKAYVKEGYENSKTLSIVQLFSVKNNSSKSLVVGVVYPTDSEELQQAYNSKDKINYNTFISYDSLSGERKTQICGNFSRGGGAYSPAISETAYIIKPGETKNVYISCNIENWKDTLGNLDNIKGYVIGDMYSKGSKGFRVPTGGYSSLVEVYKSE